MKKCTVNLINNTFSVENNSPQSIKNDEQLTFLNNTFDCTTIYLEPVSEPVVETTMGDEIDELTARVRNLANKMGCNVDHILNQ